MVLIHSCLLCYSIQIKIVSTSATQKSHGLSFRLSVTGKTCICPKYTLVLIHSVIWENMLHVLLALLVLHFELMQFILIYDNCLKACSLSILSFIKMLFTYKGERSKESGLLCTIKRKNWVDTNLKSVLCFIADCKGVFHNPNSTSLEIGMKLCRTFLLLPKASLIQLS